ncbi:hypothetical protein ERL59_07435 [Chengkuizengella sp. YPA3-1-1]|uniref:Uncharacterized protein n=1 Tax=Chengkuizengella marina TaxID=2507566 RepID=A0A6N9Q0H8_9BACL|nr:hypothetical protein [Chengkuizengella marina]
MDLILIQLNEQGYINLFLHIFYLSISFQKSKVGALLVVIPVVDELIVSTPSPVTVPTTRLVFTILNLLVVEFSIQTHSRSVINSESTNIFFLNLF